MKMFLTIQLQTLLENKEYCLSLETALQYCQRHKPYASNFELVY